MLKYIQVIGSLLWLSGLVLHTFSGGYRNVHSSFKTLWGARAVCIGIILYVLSTFMNGEVNTLFTISLMVVDIILFFVYVVNEYIARGIFNAQAKEYFSKEENKLK